MPLLFQHSEIWQLKSHNSSKKLRPVLTSCNCFPTWDTVVFGARPIHFIMAIRQTRINHTCWFFAATLYAALATFHIQRIAEAEDRIRVLVGDYERVVPPSKGTLRRGRKLQRQVAVEGDAGESHADSIGIGRQEWESFSFRELYKHFDCSSHARDQTKRLYSPMKWNTLNDKYRELFGKATPSLEAYVPPYYANYSNGKGRGVFASRDIKVGERVHDGMKRTVFFDDGMSFKRFVVSLSTREMSCDVMEWVWTQQVGEARKFRMCVNLNDSAFMNNGGKDGSNIAPKPNEFSLDFYATRNIKTGEELLYDYGQYDTDWGFFGL